MNVARNDFGAAAVNRPPLSPDGQLFLEPLLHRSS
jgi:hypothetical protein